MQQYAEASGASSDTTLYIAGRMHRRVEGYTYMMALKITKKYKKKLWYTRILTPNATCTALEILLSTLKGSLGEGHCQSAQLFDTACKGMVEPMMVWIMIMKDREEMHGSREEVLQEEISALPARIPRIYRKIGR
jgi:hypothetical protein